MLTHYELVYFKEVNKDSDLIYIVMEDKEFVFRSLTREEYNEIVSIITDDYEFEDAVCQCTILYPKEYDFSVSYLPGLSSKVASEIISISLINNPKEIIQTYKQEKEILKSFDEQCILMIKAAFPELDYDSIIKWNWKKIMKYTARAENILSLKGIDLSFIDNRESIEEEINNKVNALTDKDIGDALREQGIDPMEYFSYEFTYKDSIEYPIIGTNDWKNESIINAVREQMKNADEKRKFEKKIKFITK